MIIYENNRESPVFRVNYVQKFWREKKYLSQGYELIKIITYAPEVQMEIFV